MKELSEADFEKRTDYLNREVNFNGWGNLHRNTIYSELKSGKEKFDIEHLDNMNKTEFHSWLKFEESNVKKTAYMQFKGVDMIAPGPDGNVFSQNFKFSPYQAHVLDDSSKIRVNAPLTKVEGFNAMGGGNILGTFTKKDPVTEKVSVYKAYSALDFQYQDSKGKQLSIKQLNPGQLANGSMTLVKQDNLKLIKLPAFGIEYKITHLPIVDLASNKKDYVDKMNKGFTIGVNMEIGGEIVPRYIKADAFNGTIAQFDKNMVRLDIVKSKEQKLDSSQSQNYNNVSSNGTKKDDNSINSEGATGKKKTDHIKENSQKEGKRSRKHQRV